MKFIELVKKYEEENGYEINPKILNDRLLQKYGTTSLVKHKDGKIEEIEDSIIQLCILPEYVNCSDYAREVNKDVRTIRYYFDLFKSGHIGLPSGINRGKKVRVLDITEKYYSQTTSFAETAVLAFSHRIGNQMLISKLADYATEEGISLEKAIFMAISTGLDVMKKEE